MSIIFTVRQSQCRIIERFGKFSRVVYEGPHFRIPFMESFKKVVDWHDVANQDSGLSIELTEQLTLAEARGSQTKDNVTVVAAASVYWRIIDPRRAVYEVDNLPSAVKDVALNALRANIGQLELDQVLSERQKLNERIAAQLAETAARWGISFTRVEIREISTTDETATAMRQQMEAERRRRAAVADAAGQAQAEVKVAEADRDAAILRAQGRATAIQMVAEAEAVYLAKLSQHVPPEWAARVVIAQKYLDGFERITKNPANKVFLPNGYPALFDFDANSGGGSSGPSA
ncbi:MAG: SPFH/Band 7/PHB domain protein [Myxococcales bacterium]|nr:SPFH/Band 7/PHB domain protein [Myxococcales bacterium]MCB9521765.1 SPFH/Band 7/PHB domain protein [Myxococcales bacterium]